MVKKNYDNMLRFHPIPERDGRTNGRTDRIAISISRDNYPEINGPTKSGRSHHHPLNTPLATAMYGPIVLMMISYKLNSGLEGMSSRRLLGLLRFDTLTHRRSKQSLAILQMVQWRQCCVCVVEWETKKEHGTRSRRQQQSDASTIVWCVTADTWWVLAELFIFLFILFYFTLIYCRNSS